MFYPMRLLSSKLARENLVETGLISKSAISCLKFYVIWK